MSLAPEDLDQIVGAVVAALQEAQTQANKGGTPVPRGNPGTVTTGADPGGTLWVAPDPSPLAVLPPEPIAVKNTYGARIDVNERVIYQIADDKRASVSELLGGDPGAVASVGDFKLAFSATSPGWLLLGNGATYLKASYQRLWAFVLGAPVAVKALFVDVNATTFQMANLGSRAIVIAGAGFGLTARGLGAAFGGEAQSITISEANLPPNIYRNAGSGFAWATPGTPGGHFNLIGSSTPINVPTVPPSIAVNAFIKT